MAERILIAGCGTLWDSPFVDAALAAGYELVLVESPSDLKGLKESPLMERFVSVGVANYWSDPNLDPAPLIAEHPEWVDVKGVVGGREITVPLAARLAQQLGKRGNHPTAAVRARHKGAMRRTFQAAGLPIPAFAVCQSKAEAEAAVARLGLPVIVKPSDNGASIGVNLITSADKVAEAFAYSRSHSLCGDVMVEQVVTGSEFSVEGFVQDGTITVLGVTSKRTSGAPHFVEVGHVFPALIPVEQEAALRSLVMRAVQAIGLNQTCFHAECWWTTNGPVLGEVAARPGGDQIPNLLRLVTGHDLYQTTISLVTGDPLPVPGRPKAKAAAIAFLVPRPGSVVTIAGMAEARELPGVQALHLAAKVGKVIRTLDSSLARGGWVVAVGETQVEAEARAKFAATQIQIETELVL
ncbi:MAG TPA: ATP-grasp domain-containing protein [Symbiobacteriaceae bacterium]|nr:ATP-grasp domain-containing protein [Symbiobacteriaceae bacterium]